MRLICWLLLLGWSEYGLNAQVLLQELREAARLDSEGKCSESEPIYRRQLSAGRPAPALLNNAGNHYLACGDAGKAREYFELLIRSFPSHPNANLQLARLAVEQKQKPKAAKFLRALAASNDAGLLAEAGTMYASLGEFKLAQQSFQRVAVMRPGEFEPLWNLGRAAARARDLTRAREALEAAMLLRPQDSGVLYELGSACAAGGDFPRAVFLLARAQGGAPDDPDIALALARAAEGAGYYGDSAIAYDRYLVIRPGDEGARRDRARVVANTFGRRDEGLKALEDYVARWPLDPLGHFELAQLCWKADADKSLSHLAEAVRLDPRLAPAHTARAWLLHREGRDAEALPHLESALRVSAENASILDQYGLVLVALDRPKEAEAAFRKAAAQSPTDWEVRLHLGRLLMEQGREEEARGWLEQYQKLRPARQRDPRREPGMIALAMLPVAEGRAREIERFFSMVRSRPDDGLLRLHLGSLLLADGRHDEAALEFRMLLTMNADEKTLALAGRVLLDAESPEMAMPFLDRAGATLDRAIALFYTAGADKALVALEQVPANDRRNDFVLFKAKLLDSVGRILEAQQLLAKVHVWDASRPRLAEQAALLLAKYEKYAEAARMLATATAAAPDNRGLLLSEAIVLAMDGRVGESEKRLKRMEERWPEWDQPYRVHGLLLAGQKRSSEAARKFRTGLALGSGYSAASCKVLRDWLLPSCRGDLRW